MQNPFLFETEELGYESQFENSSEFADSEYEGEFGRGRAGRRFSKQPAKFRPRPLAATRRDRRFPARPAQSRPRPSPSKRPRPRRFPIPFPVPFSSPRFDFTSGAAQSAQESSELIRLVQSLLNRFLGLNLSVDGIMNVETRSAVRDFQNQKNSPADGAAGSPTERDPAEDGIDQPAQPGDDADKAQEEYDSFEFYDGEADHYELEDEVNRQSAGYGRWVQQSLNKVMNLRLTADGIVGTQTRSAIRSFQQNQGLTADGIVGPVTESALIRAGASLPPQGSGANPTPDVPRPATPTSMPDIVSVRGIKVARQIAPQVEALLAAAAAGGVNLSGGGYRSTDQQIQLRIAHCGGNSHYNIYEKPSSQCTPPTAPPGYSNHEKGLAIDFTHNGQTIKSRSNPGFIWLANNAARFGLYNLPSEPWHWSVNGR